MAKDNKDPQDSKDQNQATFNMVRVTLMNKAPLMAMVSLKVQDIVFLTGLRVLEGKNGLFVSMPSRKDSGGEYQDIYFPASKARRDELEGAVLAAYEQAKAKAQDEQEG